MKEHYNKVLRDSDARVARFMEIQILDRNDPFFGGFPSADSIAEPKVAIYHLTTMTACCLNADSKWHLDAEVLRRILLALDYVRRSQRPGGYFDLVNCNFFPARTRLSARSGCCPCTYICAGSRRVRRRRTRRKKMCARSCCRCMKPL